MKRCTYCGRENEDDALCCRECGTRFADSRADGGWQGPETVTGGILPHLKIRWFVGFAALLTLLTVVSMRLPHRARSGAAPRISVLASWSSNGQQFIIFRPEPPTAEVTYADLVPACADGNVHPQTVRSFGELFPVRDAQQTNFSLYYVALPVRTSPVPGRPAAAYTPGSYTIAYTPTENGCRVRAGVALRRKGIGDYAGRLLSCWDHKSLARLFVKSHQDPVFVVFEPLTNTVQGKP